MNALQYIAFRDELEKIAATPAGPGVVPRSRVELEGLAKAVSDIKPGSRMSAKSRKAVIDFATTTGKRLDRSKIYNIAILAGLAGFSLHGYRKHLKKQKKKTAALTKEAIFPALAVGLGLPAAVAGSAYLSTQLAKKLYGPLPRYKTTDAGRGGAFPRDHSKYVEHIDKKEAEHQKKLEAWRKATNEAYTARYEEVTGIRPSPEKVKLKKPKKGGYWWSTK